MAKKKRGPYKKRTIRKRCRCKERRWPECRHPWYNARSHNRTEYRFNLNKESGKEPGYVMSKQEALGLSDMYMTQIRNGTFRTQPATPVTRDSRLTFGDVADRYLREHVPIDEHGEPRSRASRVTMTSYVNKLRTRTLPAAHGTTIPLKDKRLDDITPADVEHIRATWPLKVTAPKGGRTGPNRALRCLRALINWAIVKGITLNNPFRPLEHGVSVVKIRSEQGRTRRLEDDEEERLLQATRDLAEQGGGDAVLLRDLLRAYLLTGCRKSELLNLRVCDVKWKQDALILRAATHKKRKEYTIPMLPELRALLEMRQHAPDGSLHPPHAFILGTPFGEHVPQQAYLLRKAWVEACAKAGISDFQIRDLRREFGSQLRETPNVTDPDVRDWLGHSNISQTSQHLATSRKSLRLAGDRFDQHRKIRTSSHKSQDSAQAVVRDVGTDPPTNSHVH